MTKRQKQILQMLSDGGWHQRTELKTSFNFMQDMYFEKLVDGSALADRKGYGNFPETSLWKITAQGRAALKSEAVS